MTTAAWDGKTLAADKRSSGSFNNTVTKIFKTPFGIAACAGAAGKAAYVRFWAESSFDPELEPEWDQELTVVMLHVLWDGTIQLFDNIGLPIVLEDPFSAIGSGSDIAIGAMAAGKTAEEAIAICALYDAGTGNGVDTLTLEVSHE
jgi:hypothetical protein